MQMEIIKKSEIIVKELTKGNDIEIEKTTTGLKIKSVRKRNIKW